MPTTSRLETRRRARVRSPHLGVILTVLYAVALAVAPVARAHVTPSPSFVEAGARATVLFETPNERAPRATTSLRLDAPPGIELEAAPPPPGWRGEVSSTTATWTGGRIEQEDVVAFPLEVTARTPAGTETFRAVQGYDDGESVEWEATLTVLPKAAVDAPSQRLDRALAAGAVGLAVLAGSLFALRRLRRRQDA
jgi:uncharacterized protein YcnI